MSFYKFEDGDIIRVKMVTNPYYVTALHGNAVTGSVRYEQPFLDSGLNNRLWEGFSEREGGFVTKTGPFTASVDFYTAVSGTTNKQVYSIIENLYSYYSSENGNYNINFNGVKATTLRVIEIPEIYYDRKIVSGTFSASDVDGAGADRVLYDDGRGGIYSGSLTGTLVGNIFPSEGLIVLKKPDLSNFGGASSTNFKWKVIFRGEHTIPVNIYRCRAPAGELNASTNPTFYTVPTTGVDKDSRKILTSSLDPYITAVGFYNEDYELVAVATLAQPIRKELQNDITFSIRVDF